ncbi:MAG TPA: hypothetical protein VM581_05005 [Magnetospirillaceae bacterium]|nr:hypothetical protein [Magnetospirillaceae bacterium]
MATSLLRSDPGSDPNKWAYVRDLDDAEVEVLRIAVEHCRKYARRVPIQLVYAGRRSFDDAVAALSSVSGLVGPTLAQNVEVAFVAFLLLWRLCLDHLRADLTTRFGDTSDRFRDFEKATNDCYDTSASYRLIEGLRNFVQHVDMPGIHFTRSKRLGRLPGEPAVVSELQMVLPREALLAWKKCPRLLRLDLQADSSPIPVVGLLDEAMAAFQNLVNKVAELDEPALRQHLAVIRRLVDEVAPAQPIVGDITNLHADRPSTFSLILFDDLLPFVRPMPRVG